jgi:hypothetical protein
MSYVTAMKRYVLLAFMVTLFTGYQEPEIISGHEDNYGNDLSKAYERNRNIGRGINFGNALEAPIEGEWGSIMFADNQSRLTWTNYVRQQIEVNGFSWSYFDFGVVFKAYSITQDKWLTGFVEALTGNSETISDGRVSDSLCLSPAKPTGKDTITGRSYIRIPNYCSRKDSLRVTVEDSVIQVKTWHKEQIPQSNEETACDDTVEIGKLAPGSYTLIFISDYRDIVNTIHYSVYDTIDLQVSEATTLQDEPYGTSSVYPVPASDYLIISGIDSGCKYNIYDISGQLRCSGIAGDGRINVSGLQPGEYIIRITDNANAILSKRILVAQ